MAAPAVTSQFKNCFCLRWRGWRAILRPCKWRWWRGALGRFRRQYATQQQQLEEASIIPKNSALWNNTGFGGAGSFRGIQGMLASAVVRVSRSITVEVSLCFWWWGGTGNTIRILELRWHGGAGGLGYAGGSTSATAPTAPGWWQGSILQFKEEPACRLLVPWRNANLGVL